MTKYTGPTSGRITIGGGGTVSRESFDDPTLSREEEQAVAWFTVLSPNARLREARRLKWNEAASREEVEKWRSACHRQDRETDAIRAQLAARRPDGFELPKAAADLIGHAEAHGWKTARAWNLNDEDPGALLQILIVNGSWTFKLSWSCDPGGAGRMSGAGLARGPRRDWHDASSLTKIRQIITDNPATPEN